MKAFYQEWKDFFWGLILFIGGAFIFSLLPTLFTIDLTASKSYSLSHGTKEILRKLPEPVTFKLYYSKTAASKGSDQIRVFTTHFEYIKNLLKIYESHSQNKVKLVVVDPRPDTNDEEEAVMAGLKKFQLTDTETYIFGLVAQSRSGTQKAIEFFDPSHAEKIEYEISRLLSSLHQGNKKRLGIITAENFSWGQDWWVSEILKDLYLTSMIDKGATEIKDVDALLVFGDSGLEEKTLKALDQYLVNGGKVFLSVDPRNSWSQNGNLKVLDPLFKAWGIAIPQDKFAGDLKNSGYGRINPYAPPQRLLPVFQCQRECLRASESPGIADLGQVLLVYPGVIERTNIPKELKGTILLQTSSEGNSYSDGGMGFMNPEGSLRSFTPGKSPVVVAARFDGKFPKAFSETRTETQRPGSVVLISDQDFLRNDFAFTKDFLGARPSNDNVAFLLNELDGLTGSPDLAEIRSKGSLQRPFTTIQKIQLDADRETLGKVAEINNSISRFQRELDQLASKANESNLGVIQTEGVNKQKELQISIARLKKELREAKRVGREKVELIGSLLYFINVALVPVIVGLAYLFMSRSKVKIPKEKKSYEYNDIAQTT